MSKVVKVLDIISSNAADLAVAKERVWWLEEQLKETKEELKEVKEKVEEEKSKGGQAAADERSVANRRARRQK